MPFHSLILKTGSISQGLYSSANWAQWDLVSLHSGSFSSQGGSGSLVTQHQLSLTKNAAWKKWIKSSRFESDDTGLTNECSGKTIHRQRLQIEGTFITRIQLATYIIPTERNQPLSTVALCHFDVKLSMCWSYRPLFQNVNTGPEAHAIHFLNSYMIKS